MGKMLMLRFLLEIQILDYSSLVLVKHFLEVDQLFFLLLYKQWKT